MAGKEMLDFSVLLQAPLATAVAIILGFGLAWVIVHYTYKDRLMSLQNQNEFLEELLKREQKKRR